MAAGERSVFVTGATGLVGARLCEKLVAGGDRVLAHRRGPPPTARVPGLTWVAGDLSSPGEWESALAESDAVVHLAGASIVAGRWTPARKRELRASRIATTQSLVEAMARCSSPPSALVCASASGYYGARGAEILEEGAAPGGDFLADLCVDWEAAALGAQEVGARVVRLRFGAILSRRSGVLASVLPLYRLGLGGALGSPASYFPWLHEDDATGLIAFALAGGAGEASVLNAGAPQCVTMGEWARTLGRVLKRPALFRVPEVALRLAFGEMGDALVAGQRMVPEAALSGGYDFAYPELEGALEALCG